MKRREEGSQKIRKRKKRDGRDGTHKKRRKVKRRGGKRESQNTRK